MKLILSGILLFMSVVATAQTEDCRIKVIDNANKYTDTKDSSGSWRVRKSGNDFYLIYTANRTRVKPTKNTLQLKSVTFNFEDKDTLTLPVKGHGESTDPEASSPDFKHFTFGVLLTKEDIAQFSSQNLMALQVKGEDNSSANLDVGSKAQEKLKKSFVCLQ